MDRGAWIGTVTEPLSPLPTWKGVYIYIVVMENLSAVSPAATRAV